MAIDDVRAVMGARFYFEGVENREIYTYDTPRELIRRRVRLETDGYVVRADNDAREGALLLTPAGWRELAEAAAALVEQANKAWEAL